MKKNSRGFIQIIVVILLLIVVAGAAYYFGTKNKTASVSPTPSPTSIPTTNWKTYTNSEFGFNVEYPKSWTSASTGPNAAMDQVKAGQTISGTVTPSYDTISFLDQNKNEQLNISIFNQYNQPYPTSVDEFKSSYFYTYGACDLRWGFVPNTLTLIYIGSESFLKVEGVSSTDITNSNAPVLRGACYYGKTRAGNLVVFSTMSTQIEDFSLYDQILSTFKFTQ